MPDLPFQIHDTAYLETPQPLALSRATLYPWVQARHPKAAHSIHPVPPLISCMADTMAYVAEEAPGFAHAILIHAVQRTREDQPAPPNISTLRQYIVRQTVFGSATFTSRLHGQPEHIAFYDNWGYRRAPAWALKALGAQLLHGIQTIGTPPETA